VVEEEGLDTQEIEVLEDAMGRVGVIVIPDSGMVAPHDKVGAAEVLPGDCVEDGLLGAGVAHLEWKYGHDRPVIGVEEFQLFLVGSQYEVVREVTGFLLADDRIDEEAVAYLQGAFLKVLVGPVWRVSCLESHYCFPSLLFEEIPGLGR